MTGSTPNPYEVIQVLVERGWISLRQLAVLLGYKDPRGIYPRQKGRNPIPTITIGGITRVYRDDVIETLNNVRKDKQAEAQIYISLINTSLRDQARESRNA